jgi:hypothetical protein
MTKLIWVKPGRDDGRVALFERDSRHPGGEAFVAGPPVQVAVTTLVERKLNTGELVETTEPKPVVEENIHKTKAEVEEEIRRAQAGASPVAAEVEEEEEEPFNPIRIGERPKRGPGRPKKEG